MCTLNNLVYTHLLLSCVFLLFSAVFIIVNRPQEEVEFEMYLKRYNKSYPDDYIYRLRLQAFKKSLVNIKRLNALRTSNISALYGLTQFSDMHQEEFAEKHLQSNYAERSKLSKIKRTKRKANRIYINTNGQIVIPRKHLIDLEDVKRKYASVSAEQIKSKSVANSKNGKNVLFGAKYRENRKKENYAKKLVDVEDLEIITRKKREKVADSDDQNMRKYPNTGIDRIEDNYVIDHVIRESIAVEDKRSNTKYLQRQDAKYIDFTKSNEIRRYKHVKVPRKVDWRDKGVVTEINNQGSCGACWAFSVVETIESLNAINGNPLVKLSTQQLIDCAGDNNKGCSGGDVCSSLEWMTDGAIPLATDANYPLRLKTEECNLNKTEGGVRIKNFNCGTYINAEDNLLYILAHRGPVAVAINAILWQNYIEGVVHYHCNSQTQFLNHAVQIVGYNLESDIPYYIVRNSWGKEFGDGGYIYIAVGENMCGLASEVAFVEV